MTQPAGPSTSVTVVPSSAVEAPSAAPVSAPPSKPAPERSAGQSWLDRLLGRAPIDEPREDVSPPATEEQAPQEQTAADGAEPISEVVTMTKAELDDLVQRRAQSETDRREAKRLKDQQEAERRRIRDEDPFRYAQMDAEREREEQTKGSYAEQIATVAGSLDRAMLDPLLERVPEKERSKLFAIPDAGVGIDGRKALTTAALDALEQHYKAEGERLAEKRLRDNPAFRKQLLAELRDSPELEEPEQINGTGRVPAYDGTSMGISNSFRRSLGLQ